jgi:hypothetical protein
MLCKDEVRAFIGMNILMGVHWLSEYADYWSSNKYLAVTCVSEIMAKNRYEQICKHMCLNTPPVTEQEKADKLHKVRPLIDLTGETFAACKPAGGSISIVFMANDATSGYCHKYKIYTGKNSIADPLNKGQSFAIVNELLSDYIGAHRKVYMDNWFTSVGLADHMHGCQTYICGTARSIRLPPLCSDPLQRGDIRYYVCDENNLMVTHWFDKRDVYLMSTCCNSGSHELDCWRNHERVTIQRPDSVAEYNQNMGGTDRFDQMRSYYTVGRTGRKWWRYVMWALINFAIVNAHVLWMELHPKVTNARKKSLKTFKLSVLAGLIGGFSSRQQCVPHAQNRLYH